MGAAAMKWYARNPTDALEGMIGLTAEERGYYNTLLDLLYARAPYGTVTDELVSKAIGERPQVWRRVKASLIAKGKVREVDGTLKANRVETEVKLARNRMDNARVSRTKSNEIKALVRSSAAHNNNNKVRSLSYLGEKEVVRGKKGNGATESLVEIIDRKGWRD
jgi:uncharacterized protein YdaU (DUF1376 family)